MHLDDNPLDDACPNCGGGLSLSAADAASCPRCVVAWQWHHAKRRWVKLSDLLGGGKPRRPVRRRTCSRKGTR